MKLFSALNSRLRGHRPAPPPGEDPTRWAPAPGQLAVDPVRAYVNHGRWVADCIRPYCGGAELLRPRQTVLQCGNCQLVAPVEWPPDAAEIWQALTERPVPQTRNWFPGGHPLAVRYGVPHGQTPTELYAETAEHSHEITSGGAPAALEGGTSWRGLLH